MAVRSEVGFRVRGVADHAASSSARGPSRVLLSVPDRVLDRGAGPAARRRYRRAPAWAWRGGDRLIVEGLLDVRSRRVAAWRDALPPPGGGVTPHAGRALGTLAAGRPNSAAGQRCQTARVGPPTEPRG